jgi:hypothetical protein
LELGLDRKQEIPKSECRNPNDSRQAPEDVIARRPQKIRFDEGLRQDQHAAMNTSVSPNNIA